ncbi:MAG TPA: dicarboxylate/amino acid:cation symporter [Lentimicrobium sp.]|nr:dicarboxylate/amino acid:cation symporter [Lentimicrobium sp.]
MRKIEMHWQILIAITAGVLFAIFAGFMVPYISWIGDLFLRLLKMVIIPLIVSSIITGVAGIGSSAGIGRLGLKTLSYYIITSLIAILTGLFLVNSLKPGVGVDFSFAEKVESLPVADRSLGDILFHTIPDNFFNSLSQGDMLPIIFFSMVFGFFANMVEHKHRQSVITFFSAVTEVVMKITMAVIKLTPYGVFAIVATVISKYASDGESLTRLISGMGIYMLCVLGGLLIHTFIFLHGSLYFIGRIKPFRHFRNMSVPLLTAFSTSSSSATLPLTMAAVENNDGVSNKIASFTLPLGATINMNGTALYECVAVMFISQAYGIELSFTQQVTVVMTALLAAVGSAGIPMAGLVMMTIVLTAVGLPLEGIGLILAVDRLLDMFRTTVNVYGDTCAAAIIAKSEGEKLKV